VSPAGQAREPEKLLEVTEGAQAHRGRGRRSSSPHNQRSEGLQGSPDPVIILLGPLVGWSCEKGLTGHVVGITGQGTTLDSETPLRVTTTWGVLRAGVGGEGDQTIRDAKGEKLK